MADKERLKGGLANLLAGANNSVSGRKAEPAGETVTPIEEPAMVGEPTTTQDERDLLATIEDEELRKQLEERLIQKRRVGRGRPRKNDILGRRSDGYERTSLIINKEKWDKIKEIALIETLTLKEIMELALDGVIERYESKHGEVKPHPERHKRDINEIF